MLIYREGSKAQAAAISPDEDCLPDFGALRTHLLTVSITFLANGRTPITTSCESRRRYAGCLRHPARAPVRGILRLRLEHPGPDLFDPFVADLAQRATFHLVVEAIQAMAYKPIAPFAKRFGGTHQPRRRSRSCSTVGGPGRFRPARHQGALITAPNEARQKIALVFSELDRARFLALSALAPSESLTRRGKSYCPLDGQ
jgi:hypothetical protein